jgi:NADH dehydrogenase
MELVAGATGSLGGKIVQALRARGHIVRALARSTANTEPLEAAGATVARGDLKDPATLRAACEGVDVVISTLSASRREDDTPENVDARGNQNLIDAARAAGVRHFTLVSAVGATPDSPSPVLRAKAVAEAYLRVSGLDFTILEPNPFMDVWFPMLIEGPVSAGQPVTLVGESRRRHSFVAERDVAHFAAEAARNAIVRNMTLPIGGPEALTFLDVVHAYEEALGRSIPVRSVAPGEPIPGVPEPAWAIAAALEHFDSEVSMEELARQFDATLTTARDFARHSRLATAASTRPRETAGGTTQTSAPRPSP